MFPSCPSMCWSEVITSELPVGPRVVNVMVGGDDEQESAVRRRSRSTRIAIDVISGDLGRPVKQGWRHCRDAPLRD